MEPISQRTMHKDGVRYTDPAEHEFVFQLWTLFGIELLDLDLGIEHDRSWAPELQQVRMECLQLRIDALAAFRIGDWERAQLRARLAYYMVFGTFSHESIRKWSAARKLSNRNLITRPAGKPSPEIIRAVRSKCTSDQQAANRLGVNLRTVQRHMSGHRPQK